MVGRSPYDSVQTPKCLMRRHKRVLKALGVFFVMCALLFRRSVILYVASQLYVHLIWNNFFYHTQQACPYGIFARTYQHWLLSHSVSSPQSSQLCLLLHKRNHIFISHSSQIYKISTNRGATAKCILVIDFSTHIECIWSQLHRW